MAAHDVNELLSNFADESSAHRFIASQLWPEGIRCPHCQCLDRIGELRGNSTPIGTYKCYGCRKLFSIRAGTIFESSHVPLHKWLQALYLCGCGTERMTARELSDILNVTYKTSALMLSRLAQAAARGGYIVKRAS